MRPPTREWIEKAEADYGSAQREYRARKCPNYDAACFHAQQCAEKYMKAWLQEKARAVDKTHDLVRLMSHLPQTLSLQALRADLAVLSAAAVEYRYPGESASRSVAKKAIETCGELRKEIRGLLKCRP
jgi:HEPN domain-containing protein